MRKSSMAIGIIFAPIFLFAQGSSTNSLEIFFQLSFQDQPLVLDTAYTWQEKPIRIHTCKFYVSKLALVDKGGVIWEATDSYHLIDGSDSSSLSVMLNVPGDMEYDAMQFYLGIDSTTSVSGVMGGDLDPTKGMYWSWNTGYINFKLEGISPLCPTRKHAFQFHLGGYLPPFASAQSVKLAVKKDADITIAFDIEDWLENIDLRTRHSIMSPGRQAKELSATAASLFEIRQEK